jgi:hypothetical protein
MLAPTEGQYLSALEIIKAYELNQETIFQETVDLVKADLDEYFKSTEIKGYRVLTKDWMGNKGVFIYPTEPAYDEDYCGDYDEALKEISATYNINVKMDSSIYCK